jgi:hypothetical protein
MAARNYFYNKTYFAQAGNAPPKNILNQFGANLGGPILHDKLFFFSGFEGISQRQLFAALASLPTDAERLCRHPPGRDNPQCGVILENWTVVYVSTLSLITRSAGPRIDRHCRNVCD